MKLGSHVSIRYGYLAAAQHAYQMGSLSFQYFPKNPRSLMVKSFDEQDAKKCAEFCLRNGMDSIAHAPYPVNLSAEEPGLRKDMMKSLVNDLEIADACGSIGLVVHFGKYKGADQLEGYKLMIQMLNEVLADWESQTKLLIENNAGQGVKMGTTFEEMVQIRKLSEYPEKIGFCFDTCHAFASGMWNGGNWDEMITKGTELGYFPHLEAVHLNDSVYKSGSHRDRHANVGKGEIGEEAMKEFLQSQVIRGLPVVLETPSSAEYSHRDEMEYINRLILE